MALKYLRALARVEVGLAVHAKQVANGDKVLDSDLLKSLEEALAGAAGKLAEEVGRHSNVELQRSILLAVYSRVRAFDRAVAMSDRSRGDMWTLKAKNSSADSVFLSGLYSHYERLYSELAESDAEHSHLEKAQVSLEPDSRLTDEGWV